MVLYKSSFVNRTFPGTIFQNVNHTFSIEFTSKLFDDHVIDFICLSKRKTLMSFVLWKCLITLKKNDVLISKPILYWWNKNIFYIRIFKWHAISHHEWFGKFPFCSNDIYMFHFNCKHQKIQLQQHLGQFRFLYMILTPWLFPHNQL